MSIVAWLGGFAAGFFLADIFASRRFRRDLEKLRADYRALADDSDRRAASVREFFDEMRRSQQ